MVSLCRSGLVCVNRSTSKLFLTVHQAICIDPKPSAGHAYRPWRMRDAPEATRLMASRRTSADIANIGGQVVSCIEIARRHYAKKARRLVI